MKNFTRVLNLVVLTVVFAGFSGCSSTQLASTETSDIPIEANAGGEAFDAVANSDLTPSADPGAVVDTATPPTTVAAYTPPPAPAEQESYSQANLGAASSGRAH